MGLELELGPSLDMGLPNAVFALLEVQFVGSSTVSLDVAGAPTFVPSRLEDPAGCDSEVSFVVQSSMTSPTNPVDDEATLFVPPRSEAPVDCDLEATDC
jgi:hypothetical protein